MIIGNYFATQETRRDLELRKDWVISGRLLSIRITKLRPNATVGK